MKALLLSVVVLFSASAFAEYIYLAPGESRYIGPNQVVTCMAQAPQPQPVGPRCELMGAGTYGGYSWSFRVSADQQILKGTDNFETALQTIADFERNGVCRAYPRENCRLLGAGSYGGYSWSFRVSIGNEVVRGTDNQQTALTTMSTLRSANLCY